MPRLKGKSSLFWLARYRPYPMVMLSGILFVLAFPPFPFAFLAYFAFVPLLLVIDETPPRTFEDKFWGFFKASLVLIWRFISLQFIWRFRQKPWIYRWHIISHNAEVFRYAYTAFVIWNFGCCYWLLFTGLDADNLSQPFTYFAAGLVANLVNPFLMCLPVYLYAQVRSATKGWLSGIALICFWVGFEWIHFHWDLSWPWLTLGHSMSTFPVAVQYAEYTGVLGISAHILLVNVLLYYMIKLMRHQRWASWSLGLLAAMVVALPFGLNFYILKPDRAVFQHSASSNIRIVQPNINPYLKTQTGTIEAQVQTFIELIREQALDSIEVVVLPEKALYKPLFVQCVHLKNASQALWEFVETDSIELLTGADELRYLPPDIEDVPMAAGIYRANRQMEDPCYPKTDGYIARYNSAFLLSPVLDPQSAQKQRLVPMVEQMPFVNGLNKVISQTYRPAWLTDGYTAADSLKLLYIKDSIALASLVCYESLFGHQVVRLVRKGASMLVIISDDGFWKLSASQIQHAHFSRLRAIESRREIVRAANTGISMYIDIWGNIKQRINQDERGTLDHSVKHYDAQTYYSLHENQLAQGCGIVAAIILLITLLIQIWRNAAEQKRLHGKSSV